MATLATRLAETRWSSDNLDTSRLAAAGAVLLGTFLMGMGTTWDISWHARIGRDSFWIPPHLVVYLGAALALLGVLLGIASEWLYVRRTGDRTAPGFGALHTSAGLWIALAGVVWFFASALFDDLWHRLYGIDVTIWSPPHLSLIAAGFAIVFGTLRLLVDEQDRIRTEGAVVTLRRRWGEWAMIILALAFLLQPISLTIFPAIRRSYLSYAAADPSGTGPWLLPMMIAGLVPIAVFLAPAALRRPYGIAVIALVHFALRPVAASFADLGYAIAFPYGLPPLMPFAAVGENIPKALGFVPLLIVVPAILADLVLLVGQRWSWSWLLAAIAFGAAVAVEGLYAPTIFELPALPLSSLTIAIPFLAGLSILAAFVGRQLAIVGLGDHPPH